MCSGEAEKAGLHTVAPVNNALLFHRGCSTVLVLQGPWQKAVRSVTEKYHSTVRRRLMMEGRSKRDGKVPLYSTTVLVLYEEDSYF